MTTTQEPGMIAVNIIWNDSGREPQCRPDPRYPKGKDIDASNGAARTCTVPLPYPARRCGHYQVECSVCKYRVAITTAGRLDDPKSIKLPCFGGRMADHHRGAPQ